jgi:heptosyltransferase II
MSPTVTPTTAPGRHTADHRLAERILVIGNCFLGDTVLGIPFLRNLRRRFPAAVIEVLTESAAASLLADCPHVDAVIVRPRPSRSKWPVPSFFRRIAAEAAWLGSRGYTRAYLLKRSFSSALLVRLAGIPWRVGHATEGRGWLLSRAVPDVRGRHRAESCLDLLRDDGFEVDDGHPENWVRPADATAIDGLLRAYPATAPRVFFAVRSTNRGKHWPAERWARVARWLAGERGCEIFLCGGPEDGPTHAEILGRLDPSTARHVHDLSADVPLRRVGTLLARMDLCLGIDTGLPHIAASHGVPVAVLFGPTDPNEWHPWQTPGEVIRAERGGPATGRRADAGLRWRERSASMLDIGVDEVIASARRLLDEPAARRDGRQACADNLLARHG